MPERLVRVPTTVLQAASAMPLPRCMRLRTKDGIAHTFGIEGKVVNSSFWNTACLTWLWRNGRQCLNGGNQDINLSSHQQGTGLRCPGSRLCRPACKDSVRHVPDMLFGMVQIDNLHRLRKLFTHYMPNPGGTITQHDHLLRSL